MPPERVLALEGFLRGHGEESQTRGIADEQAAANHREKNVRTHAAIDNFGHTLGMITQGAQTFAQVLSVLIGQTAIELDIGVGGKAAEFEVDEGDTRQGHEFFGRRDQFTEGLRSESAGHARVDGAEFLVEEKSLVTIPCPCTRIQTQSQARWRGEVNFAQGLERDAGQHIIDCNVGGPARRTIPMDFAAGPRLVQTETGKIGALVNFEKDRRAFDLPP